ncbi:hypothetical protein SAMN05216403_10487 [Nitrosospira multiformis ATCC 25196]|uniref:Uncharacterized protein n=1 Tax=Nitrosospira multiformis (strain ATCC 25196 / NCIMB 11849 / C 71) TaxID=323848 RepID=A0A1H5TD46_NITMU|nr:hypothetical protein SAMN05216411_103101 [Nitrosospira multiformis]SEF60108.1 hypothetical protein SAMN05216403_10487 [Nitrosospira multiformis ATCC 25196]
MEALLLSYDSHAVSSYHHCRFRALSPSFETWVYDVVDSPLPGSPPGLFFLIALAQTCSRLTRVCTNSLLPDFCRHATREKEELKD